MESAPDTAANIVLSLTFLTLMIAPGIIAIYTNHKRKYLIAIVSLLFGWTVIVGIATLTMVLAQSNLKHSKLAKWAEKKGERKIMAGIMIISLTLIGIVKILEFLGYDF